MTETTQGVHFSRSATVDLLSGVSCPRPSMIKPCGQRHPTHSNHWPSGGCTVVQDPQWLFHYHPCCGVNRNNTLPSSSVWLRVKSVGIAVDSEVVSPIKLWPFCCLSQTHSKLDDGSYLSDYAVVVVILNTVNILFETFLGGFSLADHIKLFQFQISRQKALEVLKLKLCTQTFVLRSMLFTLYNLS